VLERDPCDWDDVLQPNRCQHPLYPKKPLQVKEVDSRSIAGKL
jgi:hypothetical protein